MGSCRWVAEAHDDGNVEQTVAALSHLYLSLVSCGWAPSQRASILLHLHAEAVDAGLFQLVHAADER